MARLAAGWHWRMGLGTCATGFASAVGRLTFRPVAGRSGAWYIKGDAVHFRGRFFNGTQTKYVTSRRSPPKHWPSQWHTSAVPPGRDDFTAATGTTAARLYYLNDANFNVTALVGKVGTAWAV